MSGTQILSQGELELLKKVDTPTVCNVIELFGRRPRNTGYMDSRIKAGFPEMPPMVGYATTATFRSAAPRREGGAYAGLQGQLASFEQVPAPRIVVFQDLDDPPAGATFGEIMCTLYKFFGAVGLITSGAGRDLQQVRALDFPVFTSATICSHGYTQIIDVNVAVHVGGLTIQPGDLLHGDCNGVTTIPNEIAAPVAQLCAEFLEAESGILRFAKSGRPDLTRLAEAQVGFSKKLDELRKRAAV